MTSVCEKIDNEESENDALVRIFLVMEYVSVLPVDLKYSTVLQNPANDISGILFLCIHEGSNLYAHENETVELPNPYCLVFGNRKMIQRTRHENQTVNPKWESSKEFLVTDYTRTPVTLMIHDNDGMEASENNLLGVVHFKLARNEQKIIKKQYEVQPTLLSSGYKSLGTVTVSVVFRPVACLTKPEKHENLMKEFLKNNFPEESAKASRTKFGSTLMSQHKMFSVSSRESSDSAGVDSGFKDSYCPLLLDFTILRARDVIPTKVEGYSDPYCEIKVGAEVKFRTTTKCATLNPVWEEHVTMTLPGEEDFLELILWDRDRLFVKDFLGSVNLGIDDLQRLSASNSPHWFKLEGVSSGHIQCVIKISSGATKHEKQIVVGKKLDVNHHGSYPCSADSVFDADSSSQSTTGGTPVKASQYKSKKIVAKMVNISVEQKHTSRNIALSTSPVKYTRECNPNEKDYFTADFTSPNALYMRNKIEDDNIYDEKQKDIVQPQTRTPRHLSFDTMSPRDYGNIKHCYLSRSVQNMQNLSRENLRSLQSPRSRNSSTEISRNYTTGTEGSILETNLDSNHNDPAARRINIEYEKALRPKKRSFGSRLKRSVSEVNMSRANKKHVRLASATLIRSSSIEDWAMKKTDSMSSLGSVTSTGTTRNSIFGSDLNLNITSEKFYGVEGKLLKARGIHNMKGDIYCKIRLDSRSSVQRVQRFSQGRVLTKSAKVKANATCEWNREIIVDDGVSGVPVEALLIFDIKNTYKEYIASRGFTLRYLLNEQKEITRWVCLENNVDILIQLSQGNQPRNKIPKSPVAILKRTFSPTAVKDTSV